LQNFLNAPHMRLYRMVMWVGKICNAVCYDDHIIIRWCRTCRFYSEGEICVRWHDGCRRMAITLRRCVSHHFLHSVIRSGHQLLRKSQQLSVWQQGQLMTLARLRLSSVGGYFPLTRKSGNHTCAFDLDLCSYHCQEGCVILVCWFVSTLHKQLLTDLAEIYREG